VARAVTADPVGGRRNLAAQLSLGALGASLVLLVSLAWLTGVGYLLVRLNLPSPVQLAAVDALHVYVGIASIAFFAAKVARVGFRQQVDGVPDLLLWHRWVSWSLLVLYSGVYLTGVALLIPFPADGRQSLANAHLLLSVWAAVPTTLHAWHHRRWALPFVPRLPRRMPRRFLVAVVVAIVPAAAFVVTPRAMSLLAQVGAGNTWAASALRGVFLDRMERTADGQTLVAGGEGLYARSVKGGTWHRISFPADLILALATPKGPAAVYVGTSTGVYAGAAVDGPYRRLSFPAREVHGIAVDPLDSDIIWASSRQGFWRSTDAGVHWTNESAGIEAQPTAWAIAYVGGTLFASDVDAVYRWTGSSWEQSSSQRAVISLDPTSDGRLFASSMGHGVKLFSNGGWQSSDSGLAANHGGVRVIHVDSITVVPDGRTYAAMMLDGTATSIDAGQSWTRIRAGLPLGAVWRIVPVDSGLVAATDHGVYTYPLPVLERPGPVWWLALIATAILFGAAAVGLASLPTRSGRALRH
jgi:hypothetical protein